MSRTQPTQRAQEFWACLALRHSDRLGPRSAKSLVLAYGSASAAVADAPAWSRRQLARPSVTDIFLQEKWREPALAEWEAVRKRRDRVLLFSDPDYPDRLRQIPDPPLYLYLLGNREVLANPGLAMVGSRRCTRYGQNMSRSIAAGVSRAGLSVVSGMALGIDRQAHLGGLSGKGRSIAVLGTGLDLVYPSTNRDLWAHLVQQGLILTEFPPGTEPETHNFPRRNRIISGLSLGVVVVEAATRSGSLITARLALEQNREVFAVPGEVTRPTFSGCLELLRQGAALVRSAQDVLEELALLHPPGTTEAPAASQPDSSPQDQFAGLAPDEETLVRLLKEHNQMHIDAITQHLGWESHKVSQILLMLELKGIVTQQAGMHYALA